MSWALLGKSLAIVLAAVCLGGVALSSCNDPSPKSGNKPQPNAIGKTKPTPAPSTESETKKPNPDGSAPSIVPPVDVRPVEPPTPSRPLAPGDRIEFEDGIVAVVDSEDERVEVDAVVISGQSRPLEYLVVTAAGKDHEALLSIAGRPSDLKQALELIKLREGTRKQLERGDPRTPEGAPVSIDVMWTDAEGIGRVAPLDSWVWNVELDRVMEPYHWVFGGSIELARAGAPDGVLAADGYGNVVAIWRDPACVIDNPRPSAIDDKNWVPNPRAKIPHAGSRVTLVFRPTVVREASAPVSPSVSPPTSSDE